MSGQLPLYPRRPSVALRIIVVGGGIAGLASAYALQKSGHNVTVLEKTDGRSKSRGGIRCPPNMTRLLNQWGLGPLMDKLGHRCTKFIFHKGEDGALIGAMKLHEQFLKDLMADFIFIQHGDLHSMLYEHAAKEGVQFRYNSTVTHVESASVSVALESGERIVADVVIGADGFKSVVRTTVIGSKVVETRERDVALSLIVPADAMRENEELKPLTESPYWWLWLGDQYMLHGSLINSGRDFNVTLVYTLSGDMSEYNEEWEDRYPLEHFNFDLQKFEPRVRKMLGLAEYVTPHIHISRPLQENFVCDQARILLVGEAAHPLLPGGLHNAALAIEDAQTLGSLFSGIQHREQIPRLLNAYEEMRQPRCLVTQDWERRKRAMLTLPRGQEQEQRDIRLRRAMACREWDHMDERSFKAIWGDELDLYVHDASEVVEDWWTKWGSLLVRGSPNSVNLTPNLEVSVLEGGE